MIQPQSPLSDDLNDLLGSDLPDDLDELLSESTAAVAEARAAKTARDRLKRGGSYAEREEDIARIRAWEAAHEWQAEANVGLFIQFQCICGTATNVFEGLFRRDSHRHLKTAMRWERVESSIADLQNETVLQVKEVPVCEDCSLAKGWNTDPDTCIVWESFGKAGPLSDTDQFNAERELHNGEAPEATELTDTPAVETPDDSGATQGDDE